MKPPQLLEHWYETTDWILDKCDRFPKQTRFTIAGRLATHALDTLELITEAAYSKEKRDLPIGNRTSQFFANVCLDPLDHFLKNKCRLKGYVRYMDDMVLWHSDKSSLLVARCEIQRYLGERLRCAKVLPFFSDFP